VGRDGGHGGGIATLAPMPAPARTSDATGSEPVTTATPARDRRRRDTVLLVFALLALAAVLRIPTFSNQVFNSDEAYLATQAEVLQGGGRLYVDTTDRKPPIVPYLYTAVFAVTGTHDLGPVRVVALLAQVATALLLAAEARRRFRWRHAAWLAGVLYLLAATAFRPPDSQAANFEVFMLPVMTAAFVLAVRERTAWSGVALAVATLTKQTAAVALLPLAFLAWQRRRARGLLTLALSFALPIVAVALAFGFDRFMFWVFTGNGGYLDASGIWSYVAALGARQTGWFLFGEAALVLLLVPAVRRWRDDVDLWLWLASGFVAVFTGLRFFPHYYLQLLPPLVLLGVGGLTMVPVRARNWVAVGAVVVACATCGYFVRSAFTDGNTRDSQVAIDVGRYLGAHVAPSQHVLVWGQAPEAYWTSDRTPATRFATTGFVTGTSGGRPPWRVGVQYAVPGAWDDFMHDLAAHPPALIANMSSANQRQGSHYPPSKYPRFADYLRRGGWHVVDTVDGVQILAPRASAGNAAGNAS